MTDQITSTEETKRDSKIDEDGTIHETETRTYTTELPDQDEADSVTAIDIEAELDELAEAITMLRGEVFDLAEKVNGETAPPPPPAPTEPDAGNGSEDNSTETETKTETVVTPPPTSKKKAKKKAGWLF